MISGTPVGDGKKWDAQSIQSYKEGSKAGYDYAFKRAYLTKIYKNEKGEYSGQVSYSMPPFPPEMFQRDGVFSNGFAEGMRSGASAAIDKILPAECEKLKIKYIDYTELYRQKHEKTN